MATTPDATAPKLTGRARDVVNTAVGTAIAIVNMSDDPHVQEMAANIADSLIPLADVPDL